MHIDYCPWLIYISKTCKTTIHWNPPLEGYSTYRYPIQYSYSIDPCHIKIVRIAILTISAKVLDVIKKGVSVCTSVRSTHMMPCGFQRKRHMASGIATALPFMDSFYEYSSFLGLCHMNQPFLKTPENATSIELLFYFFPLHIDYFFPLHIQSHVLAGLGLFQ